MSYLFGPATQNGVVVANLDEALRYWTGTIGAGPFFRLDNLQNEYFFQREIELPPPSMSIALGNWGDLQIELICPHGDGASTWHRFLEERGGGLHHTSVWPRDFDAAVELASKLGLKVEARGKVAAGARYIYFQADRPDQPLLEIAEYSDGMAEICDLVRNSAINWDGRDPVRALG